MIPWQTVDRAVVPGGSELVLARRGDEWAVRAGGRVLMTSRAHGSEEALAALALDARAGVPSPRRSCAARGRAQPSSRATTVLLGGLGLGFTLRAVLDRLPANARVIVAELVPELVSWNRGPLAALATRPLEDPRVRLQMGDVRDRIAEARGAFEAILLDVDNGPAAFGRAANDRLYGDAGIRACRDALRPGGVLAVWSAGPDAGYLARLGKAGLDAAVHTVAARGASGGVRHAVFVAVKP
jgi:hypothetical protein